MNLRFRTLFTVAVEHGYDAAAPCRDVDFVVPATTAAALRGSAMLARAEPGALQVAFEADASGAPLHDPGNQTLVFGLRLVNPAFDNITEPALADPSATPLYANLALPGAFDAARGVQLVGSACAAVPQQSARPVTLAVLHPNGEAVATQTVTADGAAASFDLRTLPDGAWTLREDVAGGPPLLRALYLSAEWSRERVWGLVAVTLSPAFAAAPPAFAIRFVPRQQTLQYYVVASRYAAAEFDQLAVTDTGFAEDGRPQLIFDKVLPPAFLPGDIAPALLGDGSQRIALFQSRTPVVRQARGPRKIGLQRNGDVLIPNLPQPGAERSRAQLIIHLSKP